MVTTLAGIWDDPVWAAVIAGAILAVIGVVVAPVRRALARVGSAILGGARVSGDVQVSCGGELVHVPTLTVSVHNRGLRPVDLGSIELTTKHYWALPDPYRRGQVAPATRFLPKGCPLTSVTAVVGSVAHYPIGIRLPARSTNSVTFRLVTDEAPAAPFGAFPFHLGVSLRWNPRSRTLVLRDILVSVHRDTNVTESDDTPIPGLAPSRADLRARASECLSVVADGAACPSPLREALESLRT